MKAIDAYINEKLVINRDSLKHKVYDRETLINKITALVDLHGEIALDLIPELKDIHLYNDTNKHFEIYSLFVVDHQLFCSVTYVPTGEVDGDEKLNTDNLSDDELNIIYNYLEVFD